MNKNRLEAFSDGVIAIIITIMVLEMKIPHGHTLDVLTPLVPVFLTYILSFVFIGIYWNNHHHMLHTVNHVTGSILWANLHLLFWLSLVPFVTGWMGENHFQSLPTMVYGVVLLMSALSYWILQTRIISSQGKESVLAKAIGNNWKGKSSLFFYIIAIALSPFMASLSLVIYILVAILWIIPDKRIEKILADK